MTARRGLGALVSVAALVALSLGACSDDEPSSQASTSTTTEAPTTTTEAADPDRVDVEAWAGTFCADFGRWTDELQVISAATTGPAASAAEARDDLAALFAQAATFTTALADRTEAAPAPDVDEGEAVRAAVVDRFRVFAATASSTQEALAALSPDDPNLAAEVDELAAGFRAQVAQVGDSFAEIDAQVSSAELGRALIDACEF